MMSLYYIFEKDVCTIRHAMGAFGMAPMGSGSTKQCYCSIAGWSLESFFLSSLSPFTKPRAAGGGSVPFGDRPKGPCMRFSNFL